MTRKIYENGCFSFGKVFDVLNALIGSLASRLPARLGSPPVRETSSAQSNFWDVIVFEDFRDTSSQVTLIFSIGIEGNWLSAECLIRLVLDHRW